MKLHYTIVDLWDYWSQTHGGYDNNKRILKLLTEQRLSPVVLNAETGEMALVDAEKLYEVTASKNLSTANVIPLKLHTDALDKIMNFVNLFAGHSTNTKLKIELKNLDLTPYERQNGEGILVLTETYMSKLQGKIQ